MGGNQVYGPQLPDMPGEMSGMRSRARNYITQNLQPPPAPFNFSYQPNDYTQLAGALTKYLAGQTGAIQMTPGGPMPAGGNAPGDGTSPGTNLPLEQMFPMGTAYNDTLGMLREGLQTGFLTDTQPLWEAKKSAYERNLKDQLASSLHGDLLAGGGPRGTGAANIFADTAGKYSLNLASEMAPMDLSVIEGAANRRAGLGNLGLGMSQFLNDAVTGRVGQLGAFGQQEYANTQQMQDKGYQDWLRQQPGYGPIAQMLMQYAMGYPFNAQAPTVTTPWWQSLLAGGAQGASAAATAAAMAPAAV